MRRIELCPFSENVQFREEFWLLLVHMNRYLFPENVSDTLQNDNCELSDPCGLYINSFETGEVEYVLEFKNSSKVEKSVDAVL